MENSPLPAIGANDAKWFRAVADYTFDWESWHAPDGRLLWVNLAVERVTGYSVAECLAMQDYPLQIVASQDRTAVVSALEQAKKQELGALLDFRCVTRTGELRWMSLAWQPMYDDEGHYLGFRTSIRDVTDRHALREQLRLHAEHLEQLVQERTERLWQLERRQQQMDKLVALGQLAAGVAHEINNPLAGMRNAFELIKSSLPPDHEHFELIGLIDKEIERISAITHQMYQLYRRVPQKPFEFEFTQTVREVIFMMENSARKRDVRLDFRPPKDAIRVTLVEGEVKQILYNLIRNAIQASPNGKKVCIRCSHHQSEISVAIGDEGPGISQTIRSQIFDPFFSTKQSDTDGGMGLGLSVSRSLIEAMGGRIELESEPGSGSVFTAVFPSRVDVPQEHRDG